MRNELYVGGIRLADYGVYISGVHTLDAPARRGEVYQIPGRNGDLFVDDGSFENLTLIYPCYIREGARERVQELRGKLATLKGYQRLEDSFHPGEFRMGRISEGLEVEPSIGMKSSRFNLVFDVKPQRYLKLEEEGFYVTGKMDGGIDKETGEPGGDPGTHSAVLPVSGTRFTVRTRGASEPSPNRVMYYTSSGDYLGYVNIPWVDTGIIEDSQHVYTADYAFDASAPEGARTARIRFSPAVGVGEYSVTTQGRTVVFVGSDGTAIFTNPTSQDSRPILRLTPEDVTADFSIGIGDYQITVSSAFYTDTGKSTLGIDCERMDCFWNDQNMNKYVSILKGTEVAPDYPVLSPGENRISMSNIDHITIEPRWWTL